MFTHQTLMEALENDDICEALKDITPACIQLLMQEGVSVLHLMVEAILDKIISQLNVSISKSKAEADNSGFTLNPKYVLLLTKIIKAEPSALYRIYKEKKVLEILSNLDADTGITNTTVKKLLSKHLAKHFANPSWDRMINETPVGLCLKKSVTGLALFLLEQGAALGYSGYLAEFFVLPVNKLYLTEQPFFYLGATWYWFYNHEHPSYLIGKRDQYYSLEDFINKEKPSKETLSKLLLQANRAQKYARLSEEAVHTLQDAINLFFTSELTILMLQVVHQVVQLSPGLPIEIMMKIIGYMLGISEAETKTLYLQKVHEHAMKLHSWGYQKSLSLFKARLSDVVEITTPEEAKPVMTASSKTD